jgi:hypothetical protein
MEAAVLDLLRLEKLKGKGEVFEARCPACAEDGRDRTGNHLFVKSSGEYGCAVNPGDTEHRKRIFELAGLRTGEQGRTRRRPAVVASPKAPELPSPRKLAPMPAEARRIWDAGVLSLYENADACAKIDAWRAWAPGTAYSLAEQGIIGTPTIYGKPCTAFTVMDAHGTEAGFHARHKPKDGERAAWSFHPKGTPALPFVLGAGYAPEAREVLVLEGQWDAVCIAAAAGWLAHETAWPERVVVFGTRGSGGWRSFIDAWAGVIPKTARISFFPDEDKAGEEWSKPGGFRDTLQSHRFTVRTIRTGHKDFTDCHRAAPVSRGFIENLFTKKSE